MSSAYRTTGIILRRRDYAEADRIFTILTPKRKVSAIAKGVRKKNAKLASHLDLFSEIDLMLVAGRNLEVITSARLRTSYSIADDYERLRRGFLFLEMVDRLTDSEGVDEVYEVLRNSLAALTSEDGYLCELAFKLQLLQELGHSPDLGAPDIEPGYTIGLDIEHGRLVTSDSPLAVPVTQDAVKLWRLLLERPIRQVAGVRGALDAAADSLAACDRFIEQQFGVRFRSSEV